MIARSIKGAVVLIASISTALSAQTAESEAIEFTSLTQSRDGYPNVSPNGRHEVFQSNRSGSWQLWIMEVNGMGLRSLTHIGADDVAPVWSPSGFELAAFRWQADPSAEIGHVALESLGFLASPTTLAAEQSSASPCENAENGSLLDFWIGEWLVVDSQGQRQGQNRIEKSLDGCALFEHWQGRTGGKGKSLFYLNAATGEWRQIWVTQDTSRTGGLKEKRLIDALDDGAVRFQGVVMASDGNAYLDRTTLTPLSDGSVAQLIEISSNNGETWQTIFDAVYVRRVAAPEID